MIGEFVGKKRHLQSPKITEVLPNINKSDKRFKSTLKSSLVLKLIEQYRLLEMAWRGTRGTGSRMSRSSGGSRPARQLARLEFSRREHVILLL
ncbi:hypothetical protein KGM_214498 [Danaus plexippus plexippus]|uniref:Uncharacterized protein n=1 Tax=Danaus plexippus plexippus TaxID=278856 RepID=A0A212F2D4_DANPL|nr:hypothetical protein KGM_214498 [Danaus plexippus plexippus]